MNHKCNSNIADISDQLDLITRQFARNPAHWMFMNGSILNRCSVLLNWINKNWNNRIQLLNKFVTRISTIHKWTFVQTQLIQNIINLELKSHIEDIEQILISWIFSFQIFDDHYHFYHREVRKRSVNPSQHHHMRLSSDDRVRWSQQQRIKSRKKRDFLSFHEPKSQPYPVSMGKNRVSTTDPKWAQMWYLVSLFLSRTKKIGFCWKIIIAW